MTTQDPRLVQGIAAAKAGDRTTARRLLSEVIRHDPTSEAAWLWLSGVLDTNQGRVHCLQMVLQINPTNHLAQKGIVALKSTPSAPTITAEPLTAEKPTSPADAEPEPSVDRTATTIAAIPAVSRQADTLIEQTPSPAIDSTDSMVAKLRSSMEPQPESGEKREQELEQLFWRTVVACLSIFALCLIGALAYVVLGGSTSARTDAGILSANAPIPGPRGTLRPTFTPSPTNTPVPTLTPSPIPTSTPTHTPMPTHTPTHTPTPTLTLTPTSPPVRRARSTSTPLPTPTPTLPPRWWDSRLNPLGLRLESAAVKRGQPRWQLVDARWTNEKESEGRHSIYVEVLDIHGNRVVGQPVVVQWPGSNVNLTIEDRPYPEYGVNFPMYATLGSYSVSVGGAPSDRVTGMGLGTASAPDFTIHTCFYLTFRWIPW